MALEKYQAKRRFDETPEPEGKPAQSSGPLRFVVQKHAASRLHYDFRLEAGGVLKSWAVPKGPSLDTADKRLAVMVEDHPLDYRSFEGVIPAGNYGAGTVMVWDEGFYTVPPATDRDTAERLVADGLAKGDLKLVLDGKKLRGGFGLVKMRRGEENAWLLLKKKDQFATRTDVLAEDRSAISSRTMDEITAASDRQWKSSRPSRRTSRRLPIPEAPRTPMPHGIRPMLATLAATPFDRSGWLFEVKWDGYRAIAEIEGKQIRLYSRNHNSLAEKYGPVVEALRQFGQDAILDGEIVVLDERGVPRFNLLQKYQQTRKGRLVYYVFDLLYFNGHDLRKLPLQRRKELLKQVLPSSPSLRISEYIENDGSAFFAAAEAQGLEGIIAKRVDSVYHEGARNAQWLKIKISQRQEAVIGGFTEPRGSRKGLGSLVLGVYEGKKLIYCGHVGTGFDEAELVKLHKLLTPLVQKECPFAQRPATNSPAHWVRPELVCEVSFQEWTPDGSMRAPVYHGLRNDKPAKSVYREVASPLAPKADKPMPRKAAEPKAKRTPTSSAPPTSAASPNVRLTNLNKVYWPDEGYTKGDLIAYYREIAPIILPHLQDRPMSLNRHPNGIRGKNFFQKDVSRQPPPPWVQTVKIASDKDGREIHYSLCQNESTLLYLANLGCIELNPWFSRLGSLDRPDYVVLDLDPEDIPYERVIETAKSVHRLLDQAGVANYCKTSGKRGLHVYVPLGARYEYEQAKQLAEIVARLIHQELPASTSIIRQPALRQHRVYLDYVQNGQGKTLASVYSARPWPGATVSTPLKWSEVRRGLDPGKLTIRTVQQRVDRMGDLWTPVLGQGIDLVLCVERLLKLVETRRAKTR